MTKSGLRTLHAVRRAALLTFASLALVALGAPEANTAETTSSRRQQILERLSLPCPAVDYNDTPLKAVVADLRQRLELPVQIDVSALDELGISTDASVTFAVKGVRIQSMLALLLREVELTYIVTDGLLLITTHEHAETELHTHAYGVADLVRVYPGQGAAEIHPIPVNPDLRVSFEPLKELLQKTISPATWDEVGGWGSLAELPPEQLVVRQTQGVHQEIQAALAALRTVPVVTQQLPYASLAPVPLNESANQQRIRQILENSVEVSFSDVPLETAVRSLARQHDIPIILDRHALDDSGIPPDQSISLEISGVTLKAALNLMLRSVELESIVTDDVLLITTPEQAEAELQWVLYPVNDFVYRGLETDESPRALDFTPIVNTLTATIAPESWDDVGGAGSIQPFPQRAALIVHQTSPVHDEIQRLVEDIRGQRAERDAVIEFYLDPAEIVVQAYQVSETTRDAAVMLIKQLLSDEPPGLQGDRFTYVTIVGDAIVVRHRRDRHEQIERLLREIINPQPTLPIRPPQGGGGFFQQR